MGDSRMLETYDAPVLVTGATGFMGPAVVQSLLEHGFFHVRALARPSSDVSVLKAIADRYRDKGTVEIVRGNLLSKEDCVAVSKEVVVAFHLATGGDKSFPDAFMNSVVTTRNLLEAVLQHKCLRRFVNISSFAVYSNTQSGALDERAPVDEHPERSGDAYSFAKIKQDNIVSHYANMHGIPVVTVRPGSVYGPGKQGITGRIGIDSFGVFLHLGGSNTIPFTYIDNCADAIVLAGLVGGIEGQVFNVVDDNLPSSQQFLRLYKRHVKRFSSLYLPHTMSYALCWLWEWYSHWSEGQLPLAFNRTRWRKEWKKTRYSNEKLKKQLGWTPKISTTDGLARYFEYCRERQHA